MLVFNRLFLDKVKKVFKRKRKREKPAQRRRSVRLEIVELEQRECPSFVPLGLDPVPILQEPFLDPALVAPLSATAPSSSAAPVQKDPVTWDAVGPAPEIFGNDKWSGRVSAEMFAPFMVNNQLKQALYVGAAGGRLDMAA